VLYTFNVLVQQITHARSIDRMVSIGGDASARALSRDEDALAACARAQAEVDALVDAVARRERELIDTEAKIVRAKSERARCDAQRRREDVAAARLSEALAEARARGLTERRAAHDAWTRARARPTYTAMSATSVVTSAAVRRDFREKSLALAAAAANASTT